MKIIAVCLTVMFLGACSTMTSNTAKLGERTAALEARVDLLEQDSHKRAKP